MKQAKGMRQALLVFLAIWAVMLGTLLGRLYLLCPFAPQLSQDSPLPAKAPETANANLSPQAKAQMKGYWTMALFGLDSRDGSLGKGNQSDMVMVCNINLDTGQLRLASIYRDTYLKISKTGEYNKINQAYCDGGPAQAVEALNENLDLKVDDYAAFNWKAVVDAINIFGGIDLDVSPSEFRVINGFITETVDSTGVASSHLKHGGMNHLDGVQAVAYARLRKMDTDFKRTQRQRKVAGLVMEKARKASFSQLNQVLATVLPQISTSIGLRDLVPLAKTMRKFHLEDTAGFPFRLRDVILDRKDCVIPDTLASNVKQLHGYLFSQEDYQPSAQVRQISREIEKRVRGRGRGPG